MCLILIWSCSSNENQTVDISKISTKLDELGQDNIYSGNWLIANDSTILLSRSYGLSNIEKNISITEDTRFNLASMNKMFTASIIMKLRDKGIIQLDKTVGDYIKNYPNQDVAEKVTIEQLLTHTSGMGDMFTPAFEEADPNSIRSLEDYLDKFKNDPLFFEPGKNFGYSNAGYIVLGLIIQEVTGQDYYEYVQQNLFVALGMNNTGWYHGDSLYTSVATAYYDQDSLGNWSENPYLIMKGSSAGGGYSTVKDLLIFARALVNGEVVAKSTFEEMKKDRFENGYGYGLSLRNLNDQFVFGHNGGFPGVSGEVDIFPEKGLYSISLSNRGPRNGWATARSIVRNAIVGQTEEAEGVLNADKIVEIYNSSGMEVAQKEIGEIAGAISVNQLISASERFDKARQKSKAIDILTLCTIIEPENWFPISVKADLQISLGDTTSAIENWKKSLELNPDNQWAKDKLSELKE